jgi:multidrug transporter EmrE-like cation transporter
MTKLTFSVILSGVLLNATAQLLLKAGTNSLGALFTENERLVAGIFRILFNPFIFSGLLCYVLSVSFWIAALSKVPVSIAYPMLSIGYIVNAIAAYFLLSEELSLQKLLGIVIIILGVALIAKSS